jgi:putative tributyrin esterase
LTKVNEMQTFRTVEISDPQFERDCLRFITLKSAHLKGRGDICVFVPPGLAPNANAPIVILLHGVYCSAWSWALRTGLHIQALELIKAGELPPMIIAMPSDGLWGDGSGYLPHHGLDFEKWITEDVPAVLQQQITGAGTRLFIAGLSMGGFGALRIGVKYGHLFSGVAAHSAITNLEQMKLFVEEDLDGYRQAQQTDEDVLATMLHYREHIPPLRFDCGTEDELITYNRALHGGLTEAGIAHDYTEHPGGHEWPYWQRHVIGTLKFFGGCKK